MEEFNLINNFFYKISKNPEGLSLKDDTALIKHTSSNSMLVTTDTIVEGMHFFNLEYPESIANKLLESNLSDIAAMGGIPKYWTLAISIPKNHNLINANWFNKFIKEISKIQNRSGCYLIGGDTTTTNSAMVLTATVIGYTYDNRPALLKSGAKQGDYICVTGSLGGAYLGFNILNKTINNIDSELDFSGIKDTTMKNIINKYYFHKADLKYAEILSRYASSCTDISDGLIADLEKICIASKVSGKINLNDVPIEPAGKKILNSVNLIVKALTWGGDYKLVFTVQREKFNKLCEEMKGRKLRIYKIGEVTKNNKSNIISTYFNEEEVFIESKGNIHTF